MFCLFKNFVKLNFFLRFVKIIKNVFFLNNKQLMFYKFKNNKMLLSGLEYDYSFLVIFGFLIYA